MNSFILALRNDHRHERQVWNLLKAATFLSCWSPPYPDLLVHGPLFPEHRNPDFDFLKSEEVRETYLRQKRQATPLVHLAFHGFPAQISRHMAGAPLPASRLFDR